MFFPELIKNINESDKVLEVGPGGMPHPRSNVLLEKTFASVSEEVGQRGYAPPLNSNKNIVYYEGGAFPFKDKEFDYVICSHVLEHVEDVKGFITELQRVAGAGYIEFPTIYYDYLYNFPEHITFLLNHNDIIYYMSKEESGLNSFLPVNRFFYETLKSGQDQMIQELKEYFFQGFEWKGEIHVRKANSLMELTFDMDSNHIPLMCTEEISTKPGGNWFTALFSRR